MLYIPDNSQPTIHGDTLLSAGRLRDLGPRSYSDPLRMTTPLGSGTISFLTTELINAQQNGGVGGLTSQGDGGLGVPTISLQAPELPNMSVDMQPLGDGMKALADALSRMSDLYSMGTNGDMVDFGTNNLFPQDSPAAQVMRNFLLQRQGNATQQLARQNINVPSAKIQSWEIKNTVTRQLGAGVGLDIWFNFGGSGGDGTVYLDKGNDWRGRVVNYVHYITPTPDPCSIADSLTAKWEDATWESTGSSFLPGANYTAGDADLNRITGHGNSLTLKIEATTGYLKADWHDGGHNNQLRIWIMASGRKESADGTVG